MTIPSWARVGAQVTCVRNSTSGVLIVDAVYTILSVESWLDFDGDAGLYLHEVESPFGGAFKISHFHPLTTTKTQAEDVAMIRSLIKDEVNA